MIPLERIRSATALAGPYVRQTPLIALDVGALLKLECLQFTGSY